MASKIWTFPPIVPNFRPICRISEPSFWIPNWFKTALEPVWNGFCLDFRQMGLNRTFGLVPNVQTKSSISKKFEPKFLVLNVWNPNHLKTELVNVRISALSRFRTLSVLPMNNLKIYRKFFLIEKISNWSKQKRVRNLESTLRKYSDILPLCVFYSKNLSYIFEMTYSKCL